MSQEWLKKLAELSNDKDLVKRAQQTQQQARQAQQDVLVFLVPVAAAMALTLFFLPAINAGRRKSPIRLVVYLANLAVPLLTAELGPGVIVIWLAAFVFSFVGGGRIFKVARLQAPAETPRASPAKPAAKPATPGARAAPVAVSAAAMQQRAVRDSRSSSHDAVVTRQVGAGGSWIRAR